MARRSIIKKVIVILFLLASFFSLSQAEEIRIACIGNSITVYHGTYPALDLDSYPAQLRILMGENYDIQNFGVSGRTLLKKGDFPIWNEPAFAGALEFQPNIVTIMLGTNDSKPQNWAYKDEFVADYYSLIDTLRSLQSQPEIYVCIPPPAFSRKYDINDSVITNDMIPMLQQIIEEKNTHSIDFHTKFIDKSYLFYDGIHPTLDGLWEFAQVFNSALKQNNVKEIEEIKEINLALNKTVLASGSTGILNSIVDGNITSAWAFGDGEAVVLDLGAADSTNMFQIILSETGIWGYKIETSNDNTAWTVAIDKLNSPDTTRIAIESVESLNTRYIRFTFHSGDPSLKSKVAELRVLKTAPVHAPVLTFDLNRSTVRQAFFDLKITSSLKGGCMKYYYYLN